MVTVFASDSLSAAPSTAAGLASEAGRPPVEVVKQVADAVLRDFPEPLEFNWGEGVLLAGMMRTYQLTREARYLEFARRFGDHWAARELEPLLAQNCAGDQPQHADRAEGARFLNVLRLVEGRQPRSGKK